MVKSARTKASAGNCGDLLRRILGRDESDRRIVILRALWRLMLEKGYASTSMTDVARRARLSPSHLAYYFPTKDAILLELFAALSDALLSDLTSQRGEPPLEQCHRLAKYAFREPKLDLGESAIALEMIGIALHNPRFRHRYSEYARKMNRYLRDLFAKTPRAFNLSAEDAAVLATSMWIGLLTNSYFYRGFDRSRARMVFHQTLMMLGGFNGRQFSFTNGRRPMPKANGRTARVAKASAEVGRAG
jgi:AcrR family transcriptional regulator